MSSGVSVAGAKITCVLYTYIVILATVHVLCVLAVLLLLLFAVVGLDNAQGGEFTWG